MPMTLELRENGWVIYCDYRDPLTMPELAAVMEQNKQIRDQSSHIIHSVHNVSRLHKVPMGILRIQGTAPDFNHRTAGQVVLVGASPFVRNIAEMISRLARTDKFVFFSTEEEAWAYLDNDVLNLNLQVQH